MSTAPDELPTRAELARDRLLHVMRDYAEEVCASWLVDQEFYLWEAAWQKAHLLPLRSTLRAASGWLSPFGRFAER